MLAAVVLVAGWLVIRGRDGERLPIYWDAPDFALLDQTGDTLRAADLRGTVWAVSFVFTNCEGVCPLITAQMAGLRDSLRSDGLLGREVRLVSISVDPARDTPEVLREYAARYGASPPSEWAFLTGTPPEAVRRLIQEGFRVSATLDSAAKAEPNYQVSHTPRVMLIDRSGWIRGTYDAREPDAFRRLAEDLRELVR